MSLLTFIKCYSVFVVVTNIIMFGGLTVINIATVSTAIILTCQSFLICPSNPWPVA